MRIVHLIPSLATGGAERQLYLLCRETQCSIRHQVIALWSGGRWAAALSELRVPVECLHRHRLDPLTVLAVDRLVRDFGANIVHCWLPSANLLGAFSSAGRPVIAGVRNVDDWKPWWYRSLDWAVSPLWSRVVANSYAGAELLKRQGIPSHKIEVVPNGIEAKPALGRLRRPWPTACVVARLVRQKRIDHILRVASAIPEMLVSIAGDGPLRSELEAQAPSNVTFLGEQADVSWLMASSDFFLLASEREGTSNALLEAMQAGCVPIVTPAGDNARIVADRQSGRVVEPGGFVEAILESLPQLESMSAAAAAAVQNYSAGAMAARTLSIYRRELTDAVTHQNPLPRLHE